MYYCNNIFIYLMELVINFGYNYRPSFENGQDQLSVTPYTLTIYSSVHKQLIRPI